MPDETAHPGWTIDTLHAHLVAQMEANDRRYSERFVSQEQAIKKAEDATEKRFEGVNEFRAALATQTHNSPTRIEVDAGMSAIEQRLNADSARISALEGDMKGLGGRGAGMQQLWAIGVAALIALAAVISAVVVIASAVTSGP